MIALTEAVDLSDTMPASDAEARREAALDERALEAMLVESGGQVKGSLLQRYTTAFSAADVDDVMAIAVERVWRKRSKFDPRKGTLRAWFFRIADNTARDVLRYGWFKARKLEVAVEQGAFDSICAGNSQKSPPPTVDREPSALERGIRDELLQLLGKLPEPQRRILWADALSSSGPVPTADLARELNLSRGTVRVYRAKALARLRSELSMHPMFKELVGGNSSTERNKNETGIDLR